ALYDQALRVRRAGDVDRAGDEIESNFGWTAASKIGSIQPRAAARRKFPRGPPLTVKGRSIHRPRAIHNNRLDRAARSHTINRPELRVQLAEEAVACHIDRARGINRQ